MIKDCPLWESALSDWKLSAEKLDELSALLDAIVYSLNENAVEDKLRRKFAEKFHVEIINFNDMSMALDVNFLYFSQSYMTKS